MKKIEIFKVEGDKVTRMRRHCPKCGSGVFLGEHNNRFSCGSCGYTEFKSSYTKEKNFKKDENVIEKKVETVAEPVEQVKKTEEPSESVKEEKPEELLPVEKKDKKE